MHQASSYLAGNEKVHQMTVAANYDLRVLMETFEGESAFQDYTNFYLHTEANDYSFNYISSTGNAGVSDIFFSEKLRIFFVKFEK